MDENSEGCPIIKLNLNWNIEEIIEKFGKSGKD